MQNDDVAIMQIVAHYRNYIRYLSLHEVELTNGRKVKYVDEEMVLRLETKLMESVQKFRVRGNKETLK
jgi:hypothetical protein